MAGSNSSVIVGIVSTVLSGGLVGSVVQILHARNTRQQIKIEASKAPADIEAVLLGGASQAVTILTNSLNWAQEEIQDLKTEQLEDKKQARELQRKLTAKDQRIRELESELLALKGKFTEVQAQLDQALAEVREYKRNGNGNGTAVPPAEQ